MNEKLGIIGRGYVGSAIKHYFKEAKIWDKYVSTENTFEEVLQQDFIFLCLPTPYKENERYGVDISAIEENLEKIDHYVKGKVLILKSTVPPGTSNYLQEKYKNNVLVFNPEFLTAKYSKEDFAYPDKQILGYTDKRSKYFCKIVKEFLPKARGFIMPAQDAEMIKYALNNYYAMKVVFANQIYDVCQKIGSNYDNVHKGFVADKRVNDSHFDIWHEEFRGYSGACLPKDMKGFIRFADSVGVNLELHKTVDKLNEDLLSS
ncbi:MAG: hypothetical protein WD512_00610 [Candidatus Paceibacterota bacterium]